MKLILSVLVLFFTIPAIAQWIGPDAANRIFYSKGQVGIGIDLPASRLHVKGTDTNSVFYAETADAFLNFARHFIEFRAKSNYAQTPYISWHTPSGLRQAFVGWRTDAFGLTLENNFNLSINGGNVGIGTVDTKGYKLAVVGKAIAEEVVVKLKSNWPDYVFDSLYNLPPLEKVAEYIRKYKCLPDVPAEAVVQSDGIPLSEFTSLLLKKIEELTLYAIHERDRNRMLEERIRSLEVAANTDDERK
jgi:hypothetical protein